MNHAQQEPKPKQRLQIGNCEWKNCGRPAYYEVDFDCDDMTASLCNKHHNDLLALFNLPNYDED